MYFYNQAATYLTSCLETLGIGIDGGKDSLSMNIKVNDKYALRISNPTDCMLPSFHMNENYLIALDNNFFVFPNNYNQYVKKYNNTFQHGGISMSELIVPISTLDPK